jgi:hypothetical protein
MTNVFTKDPDAVLDYQFDWSAWLDEGDSIASYELTIPTGITKDSDSATGTAVTLWLSGGTDGEGYKITCHITTSAAREDDRSIYIRCTSR